MSGEGVGSWPRTPLCAGTGSMVGDGFMGYCDEWQASFPEPRPQSLPRPQATGRRPVNDPPSLCLRGFSSNLHCRIVNRTCCNSLRLKRHENKEREEIKHILWRYKIIDRQRAYTWTTHGHSAIRCYFNFNKHLYKKLPRTFAIFDGRGDRNKYMLIEDFKLNYGEITFQSLFSSK